MKLYEEFQRFNFFRKPHWRWERVLKICDRHPTPGRCTQRDDETIRKARNFLLRWRDKETSSEREELFWEEPGLYYAYDLHEKSTADPECALYLQARLLANQTPEEIAHVMSTIPDTVLWYERLFFNVSDRLANRDWVTKHVLLPALLKQQNLPTEDNGSFFNKSSEVARPFMDGSLKLFAYFGGKFLVHIMIAGFQSGKPLASPEEMPAWFDNHWSTTIRRRSHQAALQFEINKYNVMELFATHTQIMAIERSDEAKDTQKTAFERHIQGMIDEIPWAVGDDGAKVHKGTPLGDYDEMAAELRDDEVLKVSAGEKLNPKDKWPDKLPAPRPKTSAVIDNKELLL